MPKTSKPGPREGRDRVQIDIGGQGAWLDAETTLREDVTALLIPHLEYEVRQFEEGGPLGYQEQKVISTLRAVRLGRQAAFPAGFVPRIVQLLREHGYQVEIVDHRVYKEKFQVDTKFAKSLGTEDRRLVKAIRRDPVGQIEAENFADMIAKMRLIVHLYPQAHVLIPVATRKMAWKVQDRLFDEEADWGVHLLKGAWPQKPPRCMICTFTSMYSCHAEDWNIVLLPDLRSTASTLGTRAVACLHGDWDRKVHRIYGFLSPRQRLGRRDRILLEAMTGQVLYRVGPEPAGVRILWLPTPDCPAIDREATALEFKRKAYWHNDRRNDYVAAVARAFATRDAEKLRKYGVPFHGDQPALRNAPESTIMVLTASTEQGRELLKRLPGWKLSSAVPGSGSEDAEVAQEEGVTGWIVTEMKASQGELDVDVILRAGGSAGTRCFKGFSSLADPKTKQDVILVDLDDRFDHRAVRDTEWRRGEYGRMGWDADKGAAGATSARKG